MKRGLSLWLGTGLCLWSFAAAHADKEGPSDASESASQTSILMEIRIVELPSSAVQSVFGRQGAVAGGNMTDDAYERMMRSKGTDLLSAPRVVTRAGQSAQIKVGQEQSFATSFRVAETNGTWEPVMKTVELGISATVMATPYPNDPNRLRGAAEVTLSRLITVSEQTVTPPGSQSPFKLQSPSIASSALTTSFDMQSGQTIILGGLQQGDGDGSRSAIVLLRASVAETASELTARLKARIIANMEFSQAPLGEVIVALSREAKSADISFSVLCDRVTKNSDKVSFPNAKGEEPRFSLSLRKISLYDALRHVAQLSGATVTFDCNTVTLSLK